MKVILAVTTYNRVDLLRRFIDSWRKTRSEDYDWTLVVADDGSTDGTLEYLDSLEDHELVVLKNQRRGVHCLTNRILKYCSKQQFAFGFKADDDIEFLKPGWDKAYIDASKATGYDHLVYFDSDWSRKHCPGAKQFQPPKKHEMLECHTPANTVFGSFWTFTPRVIEKVGYFDVKNFGLCLLGHVDFTRRCCLSGFNDPETPFDVANSTDYIRMPLEYKRSVERRSMPRNSPVEIETKRKMIGDDRRRITYAEPDIDMNGKPIGEIIIYDKNADHHPKWLPNLKLYVSQLGYKVSVVTGVKGDEWWAKRIQGCKHLFMWNGAEAQYQPVKAACNAAQVGWSVVEVGWFPQSKNWFVDSKGINADASLMDDDLSWVTEDDYRSLEKLRKKHQGNRERNPEDFVLVPLQLEWDTNIIMHSPYKKMQDFIDHCENKFAGQRIIFKQHPHDRSTKYKTKHELVRTGSFLDYLMKAKEVYGLNSTCLLEAALLGVPVTQLGEGYLKRHADNKERLLAALAAKQIHVNDTDLSRWIDPILEKAPPSKPMVYVDAGNAVEVIGEIVAHCKQVSIAKDISEADIVVTDSTKTIENAGRLSVAIVAYALPEISERVNHEKDSFIYLNNQWMRHWVVRLTDRKIREKATKARKKYQKSLDDGVTVVIPCYKQAHLLERSVRSVIRQTSKNYSIIVVDDGSPDDVPASFAKLKKKWPDADMKLVRQSNKGLSGARNAGFKAAVTGWVIPLDADDELRPEFLARTKEAQWKHRADIVFTDILTDKHGFATMNFSPELLTKRNTIVCTCLIRKDLWEKVGGYDEYMKFGYEDWEFWMRCYQSKARFAKAQGGTLFHYHDGGTSMLTMTQRNIDEVMAYVRAKHWKLFAIPRVTVVIPCYNQAQYLERCIKSVLDQTEKDIEIIVVDDGSPDKVREEVNRLHVKFDTKITLVTQENKGLPEARNAGFMKAKAEWVIPLDADDRLGQVDYVEKCLEKAIGDVGVVITDGLSIKGRKTNSCVDLTRLQKENTMHACQMIRKQTWHKMKGYKPAFRKGYEDWEFWVNCLEKGIKFAKAEGVHLLIDDDHEGRMTPGVQEARAYWELLGMIRQLHPDFFSEGFGKKKVADLTVVLSSYNQRKELELVLESYKHQTMMPKEVIINDDGSTDGTLEYLDSLEDLPFELRYVTRQHSWYRLASGNNSAAKHAKGKRLLFTNGDQIHCPTSFEAHHNLPDDKVGGGVFKGIAQGHSKKVTKKMVADWNQVRTLQERYPSAKNNLPHIKQTNPNLNPIGVWGGNFSVPTAKFRMVGGYNEEYDVGWGGEENDLVRRCVKAGCRVEWVRQSEIFHLDHPIRAYAYSMLGSNKYIKELT